MDAHGCSFVKARVLLQHRHCSLLWEMGWQGGAQKHPEISITRLHEHIFWPSGQGIFKDKGWTTGNFLYIFYSTNSSVPLQEDAVCLPACCSVQKARMNLHFPDNHVQASHFHIITTAIDMLWTQDYNKMMENSLLGGTKMCLENFHPFFLEFSSEICICEWQNRDVTPPARINSSAIKMHSACAGTRACWCSKQSQRNRVVFNTDHFSTELEKCLFQHKGGTGVSKWA